ncbi:MAG TPA: GGDEF domain-containing protein [Solirubrobacteraceae bacterium]|nr:GGDEF domain-containing protein [Solirubrobacteraceae bacterium]
MLCVAGAVLFSSETQRHSADKNFREASASQALLTDFLDQERGFTDYLATKRPDALEDYLIGGQRVAAELKTASAVSEDDERELAAIVKQRSAWQKWQALADRDLALLHDGRASTLGAVARRDRLIDDYALANRKYQDRLAKVRAVEESQAALVAVWLTLGLSSLFTAIGGALLLRTRRRERHTQQQRAAEQTAAATFASSQSRFAEALQVAENQSEAHRLLTRHLETSIPNSAAVALNRNNSSDRLEPTASLDPGNPLWEPLQQAKPRSCLAVRLSRRYERGESSDEVLECEICGHQATTASSCQPLLVGGEVIGSVLVSMERQPTAADRRRIDDSVTQAAPVLANLRNLAIAETRAATDALTGLPNKRALDDSIKRMAAQAGRAASPLSVVFFDLDHFKRINDTHGHDRGDEVLASVGVLLRNELRASDLGGRMGGEEFLILLPDTDHAGALKLAEKIRLAIQELKFRGLDNPVTASFGVATLPDDAGEIDTLMRTADRALYSAKQHGRNRVEGPSPDTGAQSTHPAEGKMLADQLQRP